MAGDVRVLAEPAERVGEPLRAERHADPHRVSGVLDDLPEARADAVEHLELVVVRPESEPLHQPAGVVDDPLVVGGDAHPAPGFEQLAEEGQEVVADEFRVGVGEFVGFEIDALAEAHRGPVGRDLADIREAAAHPRLDHHAEFLRPLGPEPPVEVQRGVDPGAVLHVHPDEDAAPAAGVLQQAHHQPAAEVGVEGDPQLGGLHMDVGGQRGALDFVQDFPIDAGGLFRFFRGGHELAQLAEGQPVALPGQALAGGDEVGDRGAGDVGAGEGPDRGLRQERQRGSDRPVQESHGGEPGRPPARSRKAPTP